MKKQDKLDAIKNLIIERRTYYYSSTEWDEFKNIYNKMHKQYYRIFNYDEAGQPRQRNRVFFAPIYTTVEIERAYTEEVFFSDRSDFISVIPGVGTSKETADLNQQLLMYYTAENHSNYRSTLKHVLNDATLYGTAYDRNGWVYEEQYGRMVEKNEDAFGFSAPPTYKYGVTGYEDRPDVEHLEPMNTWYEPLNLSHNSSYRGYTFKVSLAEVKSWIKNDNYIQSEVKKVIEKHEKNQPSNGDDTTGLNHDFDYLNEAGTDILCHYYYGDLPIGGDSSAQKYVAWVCDDYLVRVSTNPWAHNKDPMTKYIMQQNNRVSYGMPPAIAILPHALWKNATYNIKLDNLLGAQMFQFLVDTDRINPYNFYSPRVQGVIEMQGDPTRAIQQLQVRDSSHGEFIDMARMIEEDIQKAGAPDQSAGLSGTKANETATGASIIESNANRKLNREVRVFSDCMARSMGKTLDNIHENINDEIFIRIAGEDVKIKKEDVLGDVDIVIENKTSTNKQQRLEKHMTVLQLLGNAAQTFGPDRLDQEAAGNIYETVFKELNVDNAEKILKRPSIEMAQAPTAQNPAQGSQQFAGAAQGTEPSVG